MVAKKLHEPSDQKEDAALRAGAIADRLARSGVRVTASLPDSWLMPVIAEVSTDQRFSHTNVTREDDAMALAAGAALTNVRSAVLCQNAGALLSTNILAAMVHHHQLPFVILAADRGRVGDGFYYQAYKGSVTTGVMSAIGVPVLEVNSANDDELIEQASEYAWLNRKPVVVLCSRTALLGVAS